MSAPLLDHSAPPTFQDRSAVQGTEPVINPADALPTMPYSMGISDQQLLTAIDTAKMTLRDAAMRDVQTPTHKLLEQMGDIVPAGTVARAAYEAVQNPQQQVMYPGGEAPAVINEGAKGNMLALAREAGFQIPQLSDITGQAQQGLAVAPRQAPQVAFTQSPAPPAPVAAPAAPSALEQRIDALTSTMGQLAQFQQQQILAQQQWQANQAQLAAQQAATAWMNPDWQDAELRKAGIDPTDPVLAPVGRQSLQHYHQSRAELGQMQAQLGQLAQQVSQVVALYSGLQNQAQQITTSQQLQEQLQGQLRGARLTEKSFAAAQANATEFLRLGLSPAEAAQRALAPVLFQMTTPTPPAPPMISAAQQNVLQSMAHRGGGAGLVGAAPAQMTNPAAQVSQWLAQLDNQMATLMGRG